MDKNSIPLCELESEFHPHLNGDVPFSSLSPGSHKKIWWLCSLGHEWETTIYSRCLLGSGCPYCSNRKTLKGFNDIGTLFPKLTPFWDSDANKGVDLTSLQPGSKKIISWKCVSCSYTWEASVVSLTSKKSDTVCPKCVKELNSFSSSSATPVRKKVFASSFSSFTEQVIDNSIVDLGSLTVGSSQVLTYRCENLHVWSSSVDKRFRKLSDGSYRLTKCPDCSSDNKKFLSSLTWFSDTLWGSNNVLNPFEVTVGSGKKFWWVCQSGHQWEKTVREFEKHSVCPYCSNKKVLTGFNDIVTISPKIATEWHPTKNCVKVDEVLFNSGTKFWWLGECGHEWEAKPYDRAVSGYGCFACSFSSRTSFREQELFDFLSSRFPDVDIKGSVRDVIAPKELDVYIPSKRVAIEFNGLYWHSEANGKGKYYHYNKWKACKDRNIQLIQVWEDDWVHKRDVVESMLCYKLDGFSGTKLYARKTEVSQVNSKEVKDFLNRHHIQGFSLGCKSLVLTFEGDIVAVMLVKARSLVEFEIVRFATSFQVVGGFTKLLSYLKKIFPQVEKVVSFSDNSISDGGVYEDNEFVVLEELKPDYMYVEPVSRVRKHKFGYRLKDFKTNPELKFEEGLTEKELAGLNGLVRIWDSGKIKWVKSFI